MLVTIIGNGVGRAGVEWATAPLVLLQVDPATFVRNIFLIIGALILLTIVFFLLLVLAIGLKTLLFFVGRRRAEAAHFRETRRADGQMYPPFIQGVCEVCKRGGHKIYFPKGSAAMCSICYEQWWPENDTRPPASERRRTSRHRRRRIPKSVDSCSKQQAESTTQDKSDLRSLSVTMLRDDGPQCDVT